MAAGNSSLPNFESIREFNVEQILTYFGIKIDARDKALCPFHKEKTPSFHVHEKSAYCFGCKWHGDTYDLLKALLEKKYGKEYTAGMVFAWCADNVLPPKSNRKYTHTNYAGPVHPSLVEYWAGQMTDEKYTELLTQRLITKETAQKYMLGWRGDWPAWVIPFYSGELGNSSIDTVQFRRMDDSPKYMGIAGHNRGSIMNAHLLDKPQEYVVVLFGAYDPILALQDGVIAVGTNGSFPFRKDEKERVQQFFSRQVNKFIVPDNTPQEYTPAYELAEWIGAEVRFFPPDLPEGTDYIDYRRMGFSAQEFKQQVLEIEPVTEVDSLLIEDIKHFISIGDPYKFASVHAVMRGKEPVDVARTLAKVEPVKPFDSRSWSTVQKRLWGVRTSDDLMKVLDHVSEKASILKGAW